MSFTIMCASKNLKFLLVVAVMVSSAICAPVMELKQENKRSVESPASSVVQQDEDLQDLMNLVNKQANKDNVMVHKQEMTHVENKNGETEEVKQTEEKVIDTNTGDVIADVKQEVKQDTSAQAGQEPETVVETKVDIPSEGVHETIVEDQDGAETVEGIAEAAQDGTLVDDLTPEDMAEFLYSTQQFDLFYTALGKLVNQSKMTREEASEYARIVALEYERLQLEEPLLDTMYDGPVVAQRSMPENAAYDSPYPLDTPLEYGVPQWSGYPTNNMEYPQEAFMTPEEKYIALLQQQQQQLMQEQQQQDLYSDINPYDFLTALWEEAYGKGNVEAQEIVQMLYDRVSNDDNTDDIGQIRDILVDSVASSLNEDEIPYENMGPMAPMPQQENFQPQAPMQPTANSQNTQEESETEVETSNTEDGQKEAAEEEQNAEEAKEEKEEEEQDAEGAKDDTN